MKILFATHFFPPGPTGGTESYTLGLARRLQALGHMPAVICAEDWDRTHAADVRHRDTTYNGVPVRRLSWDWRAQRNPFVGLYDNADVERHVRDYLCDIRPDVMHITSCYSLGAGVIRAATAARVPVVLTLTDFWFISPRQTLLRGDGAVCAGPSSALECALCLAADSRLYQRLSQIAPRTLVAGAMSLAGRWGVLARKRGLRGHVGDVEKRKTVLMRLFKMVDVIVAPSNALREIYRRNGYEHPRMHVSPYGIDTDWTKHLLPRRAESLSFGYMGQIEPAKGVDVLVEAFSGVRSEAAELRIFGSMDKNPSFGKHLRMLAGSDARIHFMGEFDRSGLAAAFNQIDVLVVPSVWFENAPLVIAEAFAAGKPVVASDLPGMSEMINSGVNGLLFQRRDVTGLQQIIRRFLDEPKLLSRLENGIHAPRTIEQETDWLVDTYDRLLVP